MPNQIGKKEFLEENVFDASLNRIRKLYRLGFKPVVAVSGGKDSTVAMNITLMVARELGRLPLDVIFSDEEALNQETVNYMNWLAQEPDIKLHWTCLPVKHRNACSRVQQWWYPWLEADRDKWIRPMPPNSVQLKDVPDFEIGTHTIADVPALFFEKEGENTKLVCIRGLRAAESINRYRAVANHAGDNWLNLHTRRGYMFEASPIYDWDVLSIWQAIRENKWNYNKTYDILSMAGVSPTNQRLANPFGEEPMESLWIYEQCFPELWDLMVNRVQGVRAAMRYGLSDLYGARPKEPPIGMSWEDWCYSTIELYPEPARTELKEKIAGLLKKHKEVSPNRRMPADKDDPYSGMSWKRLWQIASKGDLKNRKSTMLSLRGWSKTQS